MKQFNFQYRLGIRFGEPAGRSFYRLMVLPCDNETQKLQHLQYRVVPEVPIFMSPNKFGFQTLNFNLFESIDSLEVEVSAEIIKDFPAQNLHSFRTIAEESQKLEDQDYQIDFQWYLKQTDLTLEAIRQPLPEEIYKRNSESVGAYLSRLYKIDQEGIAVQEAFPKSHLVMGLLRKQGIPARVVSGYYKKLKIGQEVVSHFWVEAHIPHVGWRGIDPVFRQLVSDQYLKVAHGTDVGDCNFLQSDPVHLQDVAYDQQVNLSLASSVYKKQATPTEKFFKRQ